MSRKAHVPVKARLDFMPIAVINDQIIDFASSYPWCDRIGADVANLCRHPASFAHPIDFRLALNVNLHGYKSLHRSLERLGVLVWTLVAIDLAQQALALVESDKRLGLAMINNETILDGVGIVVLANDKLRAALVADALDLRRQSLDMIASLALRASAASGDTIGDDFVGDIDKHHRLDRRASVLENLGLRNIAREAIEKHRHVAFGLGDDILDHLCNERIRNERTLLHEALGLNASRRTLGNGSAKQVAGADMLEIIVLGRETARDRTLPRTRGSQQDNNIHGAYYTTVRHPAAEPH